MVIHKSEIEAAIGANISDIEAVIKPGEPTFSPTVGTAEPAAKEWKWIAIGASVGGVGGVVLVIVVIIVWRRWVKITLFGVKNLDQTTAVARVRVLDQVSHVGWVSC